VEVPTKSVALSGIDWKEIAVGGFHCLGLDKAGKFRFLLFGVTSTLLSKVMNERWITDDI